MDAALDFGNLFVENDAGELLYFLIVIGLSFASLLLALDQFARSKYESTAGQYALAMAGVLLGWGSLTIANLYTLLNEEANTSLILSPLERAVITLVLIMLGWAFLTADGPQPNRTMRAIAIFFVILIGASYAVTVLRWNGDVPFNEHEVGLAWTIIPLMLSLLGIGLLVSYFRYAADIPLKLLFFGIIAAGHGYTLYQMLDNRLSGDAAGTLRLAMLAAMSLVPVIIYRVVVDRFREAVGEITDMAASISQQLPTIHDTPQFLYVPQAVQSPAIPAQQEAMSLLKILGMMLEKSEPEAIPGQIARAVGMTFKADLVAVTNANDPHWLEILSVYDYIREEPGKGLMINLANQPTLITSMQRNQLGILQPGKNNDELADLFYRMDSQQSHPLGPAYFQPLTRQRKVVGMLILALPYTTRELAIEERKLLEALSPIASRLLLLSQETVRRRSLEDSQAIQAMTEQKSAAPLDSEVDRLVRAELQADLERAREQISNLDVQVSDLRNQLQHERNKLSSLVSIDDGMSLTQKIHVLADERERLTTEREELARAIQTAQTLIATATADSDEAVYRQMIQSVQDEKQALEREKERLGHELRTLTETSPTDAGALQNVVDTLTAERDRLAQDQARLLDQMKAVEAQLSELGLDMGVIGVGQVMAHLTEERNRFMLEAKRAMAERDVLLREREALETDIEQQQQRDERLNLLQQELNRLAQDREAISRQRDALKIERDSLNQQREQWLEARLKISAQYEELRQKFQSANIALSESWQHRSKMQEQIDNLLKKTGGTAPLAAGTPFSDVALRDMEVRLKSAEETRSDLEFELIRARENIEVLENEVIRYQKLVTAPVPQDEELDLAQVIVEMAQELRTPMTSIMGYTDMLLSESTGILGAVQSQFLLRIKVNVERLMQMLENLLRVLAIDLGTLKLAPQKTDFVALVDDAITASSAQYREKGITLHLEIQDDIPPINADHDAMQQVISHLLTNAYLASPPDSIVRVRASYEPEFREHNISTPQRVIFFSITDQGGGIPEDEQRRVFTRLYRAENVLIQGLGETGVGMSVTHALVTAHGGRIWFDTQPGFNTTFNLIVPYEHTFGQHELMRGNVSRLIGALEENPKAE